MLLFVRESARLDALDAADFLNKRRKGLGDRFRAFLALTLERVVQLPEAATEVTPGIRRALVPTFKYRVFYVIEPHRVVVIGIYHPSRSTDDLPA